MAHNDYLHFTAELGILVIPIMLWMIFLFFKQAFLNSQKRSRQTRGIAIASMTAAVAVLVHSMSDFNLHIPANALLLTVEVAMAGSGFAD
ncbi:MAG: hypothetical protein U9N77_06250 [Thermodesulfobacteriota bacterium]|nr:hypothetical protein [Thermodesulfobacteriota bacterium]